MVEPSLGAALDRVAESESTPPLWYALAWVVEQTGLPVETARGIGVAAGALLAGLLVVYAARLLPLWAAALAGLLAALASQLVLRGAELRAYALYALLALLFAWLLERAAEAPSRGRLAAYWATTAAGLLTHYFFLFLLVPGLLWLWRTPSFRLARARVAAASALALVPFLAWTPFLAEQVENQRFSWIGDFSLVKALAVYSAFAWNAGPLYVRDIVDVGFWEGLARVGVLVLVVAGSVAAWRLGRRGRLVALLALVPTVLAACLWLAGENLFTTRNLLAVAPFAAVALAALAASLPRWAGPAAGALVLAGVCAGLVREAQLSPPPYDELAHALVAVGWEPDAQVAIFGGAHELSYLGTAYAVRGPVSWYLPGRPRLELVDGQPCERAFVVAPPGRARSLLAGAEETRTVDDVAVARIPCADDLGRRVDAERGFLFVTAGR
jgi:4-amino-4-deoxy-L-arabinose transferase-like glycosyltransferase